jgi:D-beta-D-heptose 7-phosphate kinase/D-beta-D-heptose 1-phosphate adenosyltransferase
MELSKVVSQDELIRRREEWKRDGKQVVFTSGVFDLLHPGHVRLLEQAAGQGNILIVAIQSDSGVRESRISSTETAKNLMVRPITPAAERCEILAALASVDYVVEFDEPEPRQLLKRLAPDVLVKGGEPGSDESAFLDDDKSKATGVKIVRIPLEPGYSTSRLVERIKRLRE